MIKQIKTDVKEIRINDEEITNKEGFREKFKIFKGFQEKANNKTGAIWTEEIRKQHREATRRY